jgi:hypothetical protein
MRAKTINEVQNFERGQKPLNSMGIGRVKIIENLLKEIYKDNRYMGYKIINPDRIEISYKEEWKKKLPDEFDNRIWVLKYEEKERFVVKENKSEMSSFTHSFGTKYYWEIIELEPLYSSDYPDRNRFEEKSIVDLSRENKENKEKIDVMAKALNDHYGLARGFKYIGMEK